jgi:hypothetical protein
MHLRQFRTVADRASSLGLFAVLSDRRKRIGHLRLHSSLRKPNSKGEDRISTASAPLARKEAKAAANSSGLRTSSVISSIPSDLCCVDEQLWSGLSAGWITENPKSLAPTYDTLENVESLRIQLGSKNAHSSGIAARLGQAVDQPRGDYVVDHRDDRDSFVACCAARTAASPEATITLALPRTSARASSGKRVESIGHRPSCSIKERGARSSGLRTSRSCNLTSRVLD